MKKAFTYETLLQLLFLELLSFSPLLILLGNIVPPFPLKIHQIGFGLIFLISLALVLKDINKRWLAYLALFYLFIQIYLKQGSVSALVDFFFGPFVLFVMMDLIHSNRLPLKTIKKYYLRFFYLLWLPILIALFQYFEWLPLTFWNADYINYTLLNGKEVPRSNGLLYHGSELSIIIVMTFLFYFFSIKRNNGLIFLLFIVSITTLYKALIASVFILIVYFFIFIRKDLFSWWWRNTKSYLILFSIIFLSMLSFLIFNYFKSMYELTGYFFEPKILTGRGTIWNIFIDAIKEFSIFKIMVGNGIGSSIELFKTYANSDNFAVLRDDPTSKIVYDTHNVLLSVFINSGLLGISFFIHIFRKLYRNAIRWLPSKKWNKAAYFGIVFIPFLTIGITIPIFEMAIYWSALAFLYYKWYTYSHVNLKKNASN